MERRVLDGIDVLVSAELEARGFVAAFTERTGGVSDGPYRSLNLGFRTADGPERVRTNRRRVATALRLPPFAMARQVHGAGVAMVAASEAGAGFGSVEDAIAGADALAVDHPRLPVAVTVADCLPVVLASEREGRLVAVHAGWRGLAAGIVHRAARWFASPGDAAAAVGPAIGRCHYEVGDDVVAAVAAGSGAGAVAQRRGRSTYLDLAATAEAALRAAGVTRLDVAGLCTACDEERFFSYRRDGTTGRQGAVAMRA